MGAYLSSPKTDKYSSDEYNDRLISGSSSMQGWRQTQEDAHNCILDFDEGASFFAVYDGHGGKEVAEYTAQHLPNFLKSLESYKNGLYEVALKEAFLKFDATLKEPEVVNILKEISKSGGNNVDANDSEEENLGNLKEEAQMPLEEVMAKYTANRECIVNSSVLALKNEGNKLTMPISPYLRGKTVEGNSEKTVKFSEKCSNKSECTFTSNAVNFVEAEAEVSSSSSKCVSPRRSLSEKYRNGKSEISEKSENNEVQVNGLNEGEMAVSDSDRDKVNVKSTRNEDVSMQLPDSSADLDKTDSSMVNGKSNEAETKLDDSISSSVENGEVGNKDKDKDKDKDKGKGKGKGKALVKHLKKSDKEKKESMSAEKIFEGLMKLESADDLSESDSDDATFHGPDSTSDDDETEQGIEEDIDSEEYDEDDNDDENDDDDEDDDEDEDDDDDYDDEFTMNMTDELKQYLRSDGTVKNNLDSSVNFSRGEDRENDIDDDDGDDDEDDDCCDDTEEFGKNFLINILKKKVGGNLRWQKLRSKGSLIDLLVDQI